MDQTIPQLQGVSSTEGRSIASVVVVVQELEICQFCREGVTGKVIHSTCVAPIAATSGVNGRTLDPGGLWCGGWHGGMESNMGISRHGTYTTYEDW
ncbi:hypothetical protein M404DRAFT_999545 [Pisolithus tinctorius Marx 270]|uniref:Uncharacterized protein n=1 Tax=Pisolithus tinctorius Marx 270 TaxID=870435 RepID=A0A0C3PCS1_PISTI|nr:hypothetical protein M404DRAFT_999545 [Pisolithus tinctorius Marx 270]